MATIDLSSARAKLQRALRHRDDLKKKVDSMFDNPDNWAILSAEFDPESGYHIFRIAHVPEYGELVEDIKLSVGDIVHGLRSSLDHLTWQLANAHGPLGGMANKIQFPIDNNLAKFRHNNTASCYDRRDWAQIAEYQPFKGVNGRPDNWSGPYVHPLAHLQKLSNDDKHRQLSVVMLISSHFTTIKVERDHPPWLVKENNEWTMDVTKLNEPNPHAAPPNFDHRSNVVEVGAEVVRFKITSDFAQQRTIEVAGTVMPSIALADLRPILPALDRVADFVKLILDEFTIQLKKDGRMTES